MLAFVFLWAATLFLLYMCLQTINEIACDYAQIAATAFLQVRALENELNKLNDNANAMRVMFGDPSAVIHNGVTAQTTQPPHDGDDSDDDDESNMGELEIIDAGVAAATEN